MKREVMLLVSTVFLIAGILLYWANSLVSRTLQSEENSTMTDTDCPSALFILYSGKYDSSTKNLILVLENKRSFDLKIENIYLFYPTEMRTYKLNDVLKGNQLKSIGLTEVEDGFQNGIIKTNCPEVSVEFTRSQLT